jgi:hypothetical protein
VKPVAENRFSLWPMKTEASYASWPAVVEFAEEEPFSGLREMRRGALMAYDSDTLFDRMAALRRHGIGERAQQAPCGSKDQADDGVRPVVGEFKYQEQFSYIPQFKISLVSNPKPRIVGTAIWDRVIFIPFLRYFADHERDKKLREKLQSEAPGILNWMVEGCLEWKRVGLAMPESIKNATEQYRDEQYVLGVSRP